MKILLVEDGRSAVLVMTARLTAYGYEVIHAGNGQAAFEKFVAHSPDLVLMDIDMPVMNGFEAAVRIRAEEAQHQWAWTPIIFLTSSDTVQNLVDAINAGGDDFMSKFVPEPVLRAKMLAMSRIAALRSSLTIANLKLQALADHDALTGLCNRRSMDVRVGQTWGEAVSQRLPFGLLMIDIDNFKKYNDHYGHQRGDDCLRQVAQAIDACARTAAQTVSKDAFAARYGGEEFVVVLPRASAPTCQQIAESVIKTVRQLAIPHEKNADWGIVTLSLGAARLEVASGENLRLFRQADERLYRAKGQGRNRAELGDGPAVPLS